VERKEEGSISMQVTETYNKGRVAWTSDHSLGGR